jgi:tetratricopeptide (TPR) repeat protein
MSLAFRVALVCAFVGSGAAIGRAAEPDDLAPKALALLKTRCYRCHGQDGTNEGGVNYIADAKQLVRRNKVVPGAPEKSKLVKRLTSEDDPMPPDGEKPRPSADEIALIRRWVAAGAPDPGTAAAPAKALTPAEAIAAMRADLDTVPARDRRFVRYFTLDHLARAGLSRDELQSHRHGLSKLVNSLSWGPKVVVPRAVDRGASVFRIDLRDYQWTEKTWDAILAANPYGIDPGTDDAKALANGTGCRTAFVRGDWFTAVAARPPLYHDILNLPDTDRDLEKLLRVNVEENIRQERVARAAFNGSGVSRNNRLIERHESGSVVYWKSYDFLQNTGRQNLFAHPLGPSDAEGQFRHDGGEIIFNLPNGLQAYLLADGRGKRIDKGPTAVVSDPKRPDRAVENGLSCMSCHAKGLIPKADQVRGHVLKNPGAFTKADVDTILALYPPADRFAELVQKDAKRFQEAVALTGAPLTATEPVAALALRFEAEMDLPLVAAEAGVSPAELLRAVERSAALGQVLGPLKLDGGTVQRAVFVDAFGDLVRELRLGEPIPSRQVEVLRAIRRADVRRERGEFDAAVAGYTEALGLDPRSALAFNNRGLAHKRKGDLDRAVADFTEAIRLDPQFAVAFHNRGSARHTRGELEKAIADYTESLRLDDRSAVAFSNRGYAHFEAGDVDKAIADFDAALRLQPRFAVALNNRGLAFSKKGETAKAVADFTAALAIDPKFARAYFNRSAAYEQAGDTARAAADRRRAIELDPSLDE